MVDSHLQLCILFEPTDFGYIGADSALHVSFVFAVSIGLLIQGFGEGVGRIRFWKIFSNALDFNLRKRANWNVNLHSF